MTIQVKIEDLTTALLSPEMLAECLTKANQYRDADVTIWAKFRKPSGWLEWHIDVHFKNGSNMLIGAIQRTAGNIYEFHT